MTNQNSTANSRIRPSDLMDELNIKKSTYYGDLEYLDIKADKDENQKAYLTFEQAEQVRSLRSYVIENGKRDGFECAALTVSTNNEIATNPEETNIYVEAEEPESNLDINVLLQSAANLKARELATPDLLIRGLANQMTEDDLPPDLKEKLAAVREAVNPKWTPASLASKILAQHRSQKAQAQASE